MKYHYVCSYIKMFRRESGLIIASLMHGLHRIMEENGKVEKVYQGHYYPGQNERSHGVEYITFPVMCEQEEAWFAHEL